MNEKKAQAVASLAAVKNEAFAAMISLLKQAGKSGSDSKYQLDSAQAAEAIGAALVHLDAVARSVLFSNSMESDS